MERDELDRFVEAQDAGASYEAALHELRAGRKTGHWIWWVFPQLAGLGRSETSRRYAISSLEEASAYLAHPVLGRRLREAFSAVLSHEDAEAVLGPLDAMKLRSSATLFHRAAPDEALFADVLARCFSGRADEATDRLLAPRAGPSSRGRRDTHR